jgi:hypothetical protein
MSISLTGGCNREQEVKKIMKKMMREAFALVKKAGDFLNCYNLQLSQKTAIDMAEWIAEIRL